MTEEKREYCKKHEKGTWTANGYCEACSKLNEKLRTDQQNRAMHKFFEVLAEDMNEHGIDLRNVLVEMQFADISATKSNVKDLVWRPFQKALLNKKSTTELSKQKDIDLIWDNLNSFFIDKFKYQIPQFPSIEEMMIKEGWYDSESKK